MQVEICTICNNEIGLREPVCVLDFEIVCERCDRELRKAPSLRLGKASSEGFGEDGPNPLQLAFASYLELEVSKPLKTAIFLVVSILCRFLSFRQV
ncbi:MAG: hypothetical protein ACYSWP_11910 [Planctomycetota bacterium]|jgi:hypothetical protein